MPTGVDRVCLAYLKHFGPRSQAVIQHDRFRRILSSTASQDLFALLEAPSHQFRARFAAGFLRHLTGFNGKGHDRLYLNVGHTGLNSEGFKEWVSRADVRPVYLVHDVIPITHPQFCRAGEAEKHCARMRTVLTTATGIIGNSESTLNELAAFAALQQLQVPPSLAAWLGADPLPAPPAVRATERPTFITLGTIEARKNHLLLLNIWSELIDSLGDRAPRLLIIGQRGWEADPVFDLLDHSAKLKDHVVELNDTSDEELASHLASSRALLFPSFAEGFGLPLIEAFKTGVPAIVSDLPVFREIGGDIPAYLSPHDHVGWKNAILEFARPRSTSRGAQVKRMASFREPNWNGHFQLVETWLRGML